MTDVDKTLWVGNLPEVSEEILYELFLQSGPLESVSIAKERDGRQKSFAFVKFTHVESVPYAIKLFEGTQLYGRNLKLQTRPGSIHQQQQVQQQQQQQQQFQPNQQMPQGQFRNAMNPYQNNQPNVLQNPFMTMPNLPINMIPQNPFMMVQQQVVNQSTGGTPPSFQRSHTWHGSGERDRDRNDDRRRDNRSRDRSRGGDDRVGGRDDRGHGGEERGHDNYRNSPDSYNNRHSNTESFETRRKKVLHKQEQVLKNYRRDHDRQSGSPYHHKRRGRY